MICNVKWAHDANASFREIADDLGISKSTASRLYKKWTPALEKDIVIEPKEEDILPQINADSADKEKKFDPLDSPDPYDPRSSAAKLSYPIELSTIPFMAALKRIPITDLKRGIDGYGREMFIEEEQEHDGQADHLVSIRFKRQTNTQEAGFIRHKYQTDIRTVDFVGELPRAGHEYLSVPPLLTCGLLQLC